jgi:nitrite reductase/ring-hydroxylating ferredoxin subunit/uncharacterized membrane protein
MRSHRPPAFAPSREELIVQHDLLRRLSESAPWLDGPAGVLKTLVEPILGHDAPRALRDALYGTWIGEPLHPPMTDLTIGGWTMSMICDVLGYEEASDVTLKIGTLSAGATALSGAAQWFDLQEMEEPRRLGTLHALMNVTALGLCATSWVLREQGPRNAGIATAWTGYSIATASAWIGGHLSFRLGIGVDRQAFEEPSADWTDVAALDELPDGALSRVEAEGIPVVVLREGDRLYAAAATCPHVGGPLDEGERDGTCVTCPWHGSVFDLRDGRLIHGPATAPIRSYEARIEGGRVMLRAAG